LNGNSSEFALNSNIVTSITETNNNDISVFPNPTNDFVYIKGLSQNSELIITDCTGRELINQKTNNNVLINLTNVPSGMYILNVVTENKRITKFKLIKL